MATVNQDDIFAFPQDRKDSIPPAKKHKQSTRVSSSALRPIRQPRPVSLASQPTGQVSSSFDFTPDRAAPSLPKSPFDTQSSSSAVPEKLGWNSDWLQKPPSSFSAALPTPPPVTGDQTIPLSTSTSISANSKNPHQAATRSPTLAEMLKQQVLNRRRQLLHRPSENDAGLHEAKAAPIFTESARARTEMHENAATDPTFSQYGLIAGDASGSNELFYYNVAAPSSTFICGSQGSGKSHSLSCLLENCLLSSDANELPRPLTGIVFHYDTFISDHAGSPCEAAFLSTNPNVKVRVLCAPTNVQSARATYSRLPNVTVEELRLNERDLNTKRMMDLMAVRVGDNMPLYMHVVNRILRDLRLEQQRTGTDFNYRDFRTLLGLQELTDGQRNPLEQRLDTLESFMARQSVEKNNKSNKKNGALTSATRAAGIDWTPRAGQLTIVDLSCPCVTPESACSLFNICLSLFLEQDAMRVGRVIALDEAHKYMNESGEASALTEQLLATIRLQRHLGARVIISTQEPTVSPKLLDLCSVTIVHRFTSPEWLRALKKHLAGVSEGSRMLAQATGWDEDEDEDEDEDDKVEDLTEGLRMLSVEGRGEQQAMLSLFSEIVGLRVGEALLFAPSAVLDVQADKAKKLSNGVLKVRIRNRVTADGGQSVLAA